MIFVSYTRNDDRRVQALKDDLERLHWQVWLDHEIHGGEQWWREIIGTIQQAKVFVFALSDASWRSKPCQEELDYAKKLGLPVLPVQVGPVHNLRIPIMETQAIDYRERTPEAVLALVAALADLASRRIVLPDPLPDPPAVPFEYLYRMAERLGPKPIPADDQELLIAQFRSKLRNEDDDVARADIVKLLKELRRRKELTVGNAEEVDSLLEAAERVVAETEDGATRLPPTDHWRQGRTKPPPEQETERPSPPPAVPPSAPPKRERKPEPPQPPRPAHQWPGTREPEPAKTEPEQEPGATPEEQPKGDEAPVWLRTLVQNGAVTPPRQPATSPAAPTGGWWQATEQQKPAAPEPAPKAKRALAFVSAVLGATGLPFLFFAVAREDRVVERVGVVLLLVTVALGLSLALVSLTRKEPRSRAAVVIAGIGLAGVLLFAAFSGVF
ncbi:toll/interleukin-1 receptor domain-containing protein [Lentzea sp. NPDC059081]|uniref:toll/interleukin-1 receptor domain-containing protein n=1 Tax=Lentzea sp. NPDC059081 TaxID=3346719 RepID=UPI0036C193C2